MYPRRVLAVAFALVATLATVRAGAWQEAHEASDDVDIRVAPDGVAAVQHHVRWRVVHGPLRWIDLSSFEVGPDGVEPSIEVTAEDGRKLSAHVTAVPDPRRDAKHDEVREPGRDVRAIRIEVDEPKAFMRGTFTFEVRYRVDWVASHALAIDGPAWRLTWSGPVAVDGLDSTRVTFDFPAAPEEPRAILADTGAVDDTAVSALRREPTRDVLELVRPHVAKGDPITWTVRVDPRSLAGVVDPRLRPPSRAKLPEEPNRVLGASLAAVLAALGVALALLVLHKARAFGADCAANGAEARGLLPFSPIARATLAGASLAAGVGLQVLDPGDSTAGAALVALATMAAVIRPVASVRARRGAGRWLAIRPNDAFSSVRRGGHWLDLDSPAGRVSAAVAVALLTTLVLVASFAGRTLDPRLAWWLSLDATAFVPIFVTGRGSSLPPDGSGAGAAWLAKVFDRLRSSAALRVAPWLRSVAQGPSSSPGQARTPEGDELRLLVLPRAATPGLVGIEVGLAWNPTPVGWAATPQVLVRVVERSPAATRVLQAVPSIRTTFGRHADERVGTMSPRAPGVRGTTALVRDLVEALTDRRQEARAYELPERRVTLASPVAGEGGTRGAAQQRAAASSATPSC